MKTEKELNQITEKIIGCAIEIHRELGPGLLESIYESALCIEVDSIGLAYERQKSLSVIYKNKSLGNFRVDLVVDGSVVLELKSVERYDPLFEAQILSYMKLGHYPLGLLINFNVEILKDGIKRLMN